ncbi:hypothetical protein [Pseudoalteromonas sp. R3]|uniref:hypothetical protein n=1 Tax=Pseudoalteromonas sp. R3 TaxID=1709477 RepID=UPI0006B6718E|nr:hypothetical protein [Pseudoalteromonas sp. R3]AZZ98747.1 hypothetical protein ELR70_17575 [Pseudoalteromonas sp. R3]
MHRVNVRHITPTQPINVGMLRLNVDPYASRILLLDRDSNTLIASIVPDGPKIARFMPAAYTVEPRLLVLMLDDTKVYSAAVLDHVQAEVVDLVTLNAE